MKGGERGRDCSICSRLSYFQGDYTSVDIGEPWQKAGESGRKGRRLVGRREADPRFRGLFYAAAMHPLRINAETRPDLQVHSRLVASAVDSALIQAVFSASSPAMKRRSAF